MVNNIKKLKKLLSMALVFTLCMNLLACTHLSARYNKDYILSSMHEFFSTDKAKGVAHDLVIPAIDSDKFAGIDTRAESYFIAPIDHMSDAMSFYKKPYTRMSMASLTKLMTALVILENVEDLDTIYHVSSDAVDLDKDSSIAELEEGDSLTVRQLLYGLLIPSGNDAAYVLAENFDGSVDNFLIMMNNEAERIGCLNTHFANPHGLDNEYHFTSSYDLYIILTHLLKYPIFEEITKLKSYTTEVTTIDGSKREVTWENTNYYLIGDYVINSKCQLLGGKTGTTTSAGYCLALVVKSKKSGERYIAIMLHETTKSRLYNSMNGLLNKVN